MHRAQHFIRDNAMLVQDFMFCAQRTDQRMRLTAEYREYRGRNAGVTQLDVILLDWQRRRLSGSSVGGSSGRRCDSGHVVPRHILYLGNGHERRGGLYGGLHRKLRNRFGRNRRRGIGNDGNRYAGLHRLGQ